LQVVDTALLKIELAMRTGCAAFGLPARALAEAGADLITGVEVRGGEVVRSAYALR